MLLCYFLPREVGLEGLSLQSDCCFLGAQQKRRKTFQADISTCEHIQASGSFYPVEDIK